MNIVSPVFSEYFVNSGAVEVNGRMFKTWQQASNVYRKEKDMQAYLSMCNAYDQNEHSEELERIEPSLESPQWEIAALAKVGPDFMFRARLLEDVKYSILDFEASESKGFVTGWILSTPQNLKAVRDRTLYLDESSVIFGDVMGKAVVIDSHCIGSIRDTTIRNSEVAFCVIDGGSSIIDSKIKFSKLSATKSLHSRVAQTTANNSLISSCDANAFTLIRSQITDVSGNFAGLRDCNICSKVINGCKVSNHVEVGKNDTMANVVENTLINSLTHILLEADHEGLIAQARKHLVSGGKAVSSSVDWKLSKGIEGVVATAVPHTTRTEIDLSGDMPIPPFIPAVTNQASDDVSDTGEQHERRNEKPTTNTGKKDRHDEEDEEDDLDMEDNEYLNLKR